MAIDLDIDTSIHIPIKSFECLIHNHDACHMPEVCSCICHRPIVENRAIVGISWAVLIAMIGYIVGFVLWRVL